jgi:hypothetical protein
MDLGRRGIVGKLKTTKGEIVRMLLKLLDGRNSMKDLKTLHRN